MSVRRHIALMTVFILVGYTVGMTVGILNGWGVLLSLFPATLLAAALPLAYNYAVGPGRRFFEAEWRDRHLRRYGVRQHRDFLASRHRVLRSALKPGSTLDRAACVAAVRARGTATGEDFWSIGQCASHLRQTSAVEKFTADELVDIISVLGGIRIPADSFVQLVEYADDAAEIVRYLTVTRDAEVSLELMRAGVAPEYASAI